MEGISYTHFLWITVENDGQNEQMRRNPLLADFSAIGAQNQRTLSPRGIPRDTKKMA